MIVRGIVQLSERLEPFVQIARERRGIIIAKTRGVKTKLVVLVVRETRHLLYEHLISTCRQSQSLFLLAYPRSSNGSVCACEPVDILELENVGLPRHENGPIQGKTAIPRGAEDVIVVPVTSEKETNVSVSWVNTALSRTLHELTETAPRN